MPLAFYFVPSMLLTHVLHIHTIIPSTSQPLHLFDPDVGPQPRAASLLTYNVASHH